jgi:cell division septal protein FtsQ
MTDFKKLQLLYKKNAKQVQETFEIMPSVVKPIVTLSDAENKYITRYFIQLVTDKDYIVEVDKIQFENLKNNPRFNCLKLQWKIVGKKESERKTVNVVIFGVQDINRETILKADLTMAGLKQYITDYTEFWFAEES